MIGFTTDSAADSCKDIDFALYADHGNVRVYEKYEKPDKEGKRMGNAMGYRSNHNFGTYVGGDARTKGFHGMIGFTTDSTADSCYDIDFALYADHGNVRVYEKYEKPDKE